MLAYDDDGGGGYSSRLDTLLMANTKYLLQVVNRDGNGGSCKLQVEQSVVLGPLEVCGTDSSSSSCTFADFQSQWFCLKECSKITAVAITTIGLLGDCDTVLNLYADDGKELLAHDDDGGGGYIFTSGYLINGKY